MKTFTKIATFVAAITFVVTSAARAVEAKEKTYLCNRVGAPNEIISFHVGGNGIQFNEWKSAFGHCEMTTSVALPLNRVRTKSYDGPGSTPKGFTYQTNYDWYYTASYFLTFDEPISQHQIGSVIRLEMAGDDYDGCSFHREQFSCQVN